jgi:putative heme-binding domain-containing protein
MFSAPKALGAVAVLATLWAAQGVDAQSPAASPSPPRQNDSPPDATRGRQTFAAHCAGCHGLDGGGGQRAPNIAESPKVQALSDQQLIHMVENGIAGTGMPAFRTLASPDVQAVVAYLRSLQGENHASALPGDGERGKAIFFGQAGCSGCHMVAGKGGFIASDLSAYARTHDVDQTQRAIIDPTASGEGRARMATAVVRGQKYVGRIRNEDNFSLQLERLDGTFQFISKSDLERLEYNSRGLEHSGYGASLSPAELNDVVSYLAREAGSSGSRTAPEADDEP